MIDLIEYIVILTALSGIISWATYEYALKNKEE
jgi:hypothetical protein